jgi:hypothetical protein
MVSTLPICHDSELRLSQLLFYTRPNGESRVVPKFDKWNYADTEELAKIKKGTVAREEVFNKTMENFTPYF